VPWPRVTLRSTHGYAHFVPRGTLGVMAADSTFWPVAKFNFSLSILNPQPSTTLIGAIFFSDFFFEYIFPATLQLGAISAFFLRRV
jgi:hypothetical protein